MRTEHDLMPDDVISALERSAECLSAEARGRIRHTVMSSVRHDSRAHFFASISHRIAVAATTIGILGGGIAYAADNALPGEPLYELKRAAENALVAVLPSGALEDSLLVGVAGRRAGEAADLSQGGAAQYLIDNAIDEVLAAVDDAEDASGPLTGEEAARIQEQARDASAQTREAISDAVDPVDETDAEDDAPDSPSEPSGNGDPEDHDPLDRSDETTYGGSH